MKNILLLIKITKNSFERFINGKKIVFADSIAAKISASVNSVHYFSVLSFGLNNKDVSKEYLKKNIYE